MSAKHPTSQNRLDWIDYTKGLAILAIVIFHFFQNYPDRINLVSILDRNGARLGFAAVDIFFVIAGFNTSYSLAAIAQKNGGEQVKTNWKLWLKKRLSRLYPTYWLAITLSCLLFYLFSAIKIKSLFDFLLIIIGFPGYARFKTLNPGFWFFSVILQAYLAMPLIFYICKSKPKKILVLGLLIGILTKLACFVVDNKSGLFGFLLQNNFLGSYLFQLSLGIYWGFIYYSQQSFRKVDVTITSFVFAIGSALYLVMAVSKRDILYMLGFDMFFTPFFIISLYWIFVKLSKHKRASYGLKLLALAGVYSYQIYLIHQPLLFVLLPYLKKNIPLDAYPLLLLSIIATIVMITVYVIAFTQLEALLRKIVGKIRTKPV